MIQQVHKQMDNLNAAVGALQAAAAPAGRGAERAGGAL